MVLTQCYRTAYTLHNTHTHTRRTASDIRRKYGRGADSVGAAASHARSKLAERGEKLSAINQLTAEMQGVCRVVGPVCVVLK